MSKSRDLPTGRPATLPRIANTPLSRQPHHAPQSSALAKFTAILHTFGSHDTPHHQPNSSDVDPQLVHQLQLSVDDEEYYLFFGPQLSNRCVDEISPINFSLRDFAANALFNFQLRKYDDNQITDLDKLCLAAIEKNKALLDAYHQQLSEQRAAILLNIQKKLETPIAANALKLLQEIDEQTPIYNAINDYLDRYKAEKIPVEKSQPFLDGIEQFTVTRLQKISGILNFHRELATNPDTNTPEQNTTPLNTNLYSIEIKPRDTSIPENDFSQSDFITFLLINDASKFSPQSIDHHREIALANLNKLRAEMRSIYANRKGIYANAKQAKNNFVLSYVSSLNPADIEEDLIRAKACLQISNARHKKGRLPDKEYLIILNGCNQHINAYLYEIEPLIALLPANAKKRNTGGLADNSKQSNNIRSKTTHVKNNAVAPMNPAPVNTYYFFRDAGLVATPQQTGTPPAQQKSKAHEVKPHVYYPTLYPTLRVRSWLKSHNHAIATPTEQAEPSEQQQSCSSARTPS